MEPQIQYARTTDGVNIAYYAIGQGPAQLTLIMPPSHLEMEWRVEPLRLAYTAAAQQSTFVRLDPRGFGLSDRDPEDFTLDSLVLDIEAVVEKLGLDKIRIYCWGFATIPALVYAARHPQTVTHLAQTPPAASLRDLVDERIEKLSELTDIDSDLAGEIMTRLMNPDFGDQVVREVIELGNAAFEHLEMKRFMEEARRSWDADAEAASLSTPTLLIHQRNSKGFSSDRTRRVAGLIPNARVVFVDSVFEGAALAQRFFADSLDPAPVPTRRADRTSSDSGGFRTILLTDMEGSTTRTQRLGDAEAQEILRTHNSIVRDALKAHDGSETKHTGDGIMASFASASRALECAIAIQRALAQHNESAEQPIGVRIGLNAGEPVAEEEDLFGTAVQLAARICAHAEPGQVLLPEGVRHLVAGKNYLFSDLGDVALRGFEDPVRLFDLRWREDG